MSTVVKGPETPVATKPSQVSELEARQVAEAARETEWSMPSFVRELFLGKLNLDLIDPPPPQDPEERARGAEFLTAVLTLLETVDGDEIEETGKVPEAVIERLRAIGAFGIKI